MPNCNFNACYCGPYYPRPINTCSCLNRCSVGTVINPTIPREWAVFVLTGSSNVSSNATVPVALSTSSGTSITDAGSGFITLTPGTYEISYSLDAVIPSGGNVSFALEEGSDVITGTTTTSSGEENEVANLALRTILNLTSTTTIGLVNTTSEAVTVNNANVTILKL